MNPKLEKLKSIGCNVEEALVRCVDDEDFLLHCIDLTLKDPGFETVKEALEKNDVHAGFEASHNLKGVTANVGLTPLYELVVQIVEPLRAGSAEGLMPICDQMLAKRDELLKLISE